MSIEEISPLDYFIECITERYVDFDGRARRSEYWYFRLFMMLSYFPFIFLMIVGTVLENEIFTIIGGALIVILALALFLPSLAVTVRRLHDTGKSGWFYLIAFIPGASIVLLVFTILEGDPFPNRYGPDPKSYTEPELTDHLQQR